VEATKRHDVQGGGARMSSIAIDNEADVAAIDLRNGVIARTDEVGSSLLANYGHDGALMSVDILSLRALQRADVVSSLRELLAAAGVQRSVPAASPRRARGQIVLHRQRLDLVDMLVFQVNGTQVDVNEHLAEAYV
jgi:uncharacterized protein YuzE